MADSRAETPANRSRPKFLFGNGLGAVQADVRSAGWSNVGFTWDGWFNRHSHLCQRVHHRGTPESLVLLLLGEQH